MFVRLIMLIILALFSNPLLPQRALQKLIDVKINYQIEKQLSFRFGSFLFPPTTNFFWRIGENLVLLTKCGPKRFLLTKCGPCIFCRNNYYNVVSYVHIPLVP